MSSISFCGFKRVASLCLSLIICHSFMLVVSVDSVKVLFVLALLNQVLLNASLVIISCAGAIVAQLTTLLDFCLQGFD